MAPTSTLPDNPVFAFCPEYGPPGRPQQIRIVFEHQPGYVPTALVALTLEDAETAVQPAQRPARARPRCVDETGGQIHGRDGTRVRLHRALTTSLSATHRANPNASDGTLNRHRCAPVVCVGEHCPVQTFFFRARIDSVQLFRRLAKPFLPGEVDGPVRRALVPSRPRAGKIPQFDRMTSAPSSMGARNASMQRGSSWAGLLTHVPTARTVISCAGQGPSATA